MAEARLTRDAMLMQMAEVVAKRGTCSRLHVGVVFSKDGRVISMGYNGAPAGMPHCDHECDCDASLPEYPKKWPHDADCKSLQPCATAEHAERNGIAFAARHGVALLGTTMHVTHMPCLECARSVINAGVEEVFYLHDYRKFDGVELLEQAGITVIDLSSSEW